MGIIAEGEVVVEEMELGQTQESPPLM